MRRIPLTIVALVLSLLVACAQTQRQQYANGMILYNTSTELMITALETGAWDPSPVQAAELLRIDNQMDALLDQIGALYLAGDPTFDSKMAEFLALVRSARMLAQAVEPNSNTEHPPRSDPE